MSGFGLGLLAALLWGVTDSLAAITARRLGTLRTVSLSLVVSVSVLAAGMLVTSSWTALEAALPVVGIGVIAALANLTLWHALRSGPVSVVSPIAGTVGAVTVLLAVVMLGEEPGPLQLLAVPVAVCGSVLTAVVFHPAERRASLVGPGPVLAMFAVLAYALAGVLMRDPVRDIGWLPVAFVSRSANATFCWVVLAIAVLSARRRDSHPAWARLASPEPMVVASTQRTPVLPVGWSLLVLGLTDVGGLICFSIGLGIAPAWLIGLLASFGPAVGVGVGLVWLGERLARAQWLGLALILVSLLLVAVGEVGQA